MHIAELYNNQSFYTNLSFAFEPFFPPSRFRFSIFDYPAFPFCLSFNHIPTQYGPIQYNLAVGGGDEAKRKTD